VVICPERGADLHMAQLMPLSLAVSCFSKIQIGFTFLVLAHPGSPGKRAIKWVYVCMFVKVRRQCRQGIAPGAARRYAPPPPLPMAVQRWQKSRRIYVRRRTGPLSKRLWWPAVAKLQAASVPIA